MQNLPNLQNHGIPENLVVFEVFDKLQKLQEGGGGGGGSSVGGGYKHAPWLARPGLAGLQNLSNPSNLCSIMDIFTCISVYLQAFVRIMCRKLIPR